MGIASSEEHDNKEKAVLHIRREYNTIYEWLEQAWKKHSVIMKSSETSVVDLAVLGEGWTFLINLFPNKSI